MTYYIILMTFFLLTRDSLMHSNITMVSTMPIYKYPVLIHLIICALYYRHAMIRLYKKINHLPYSTIIINATALIMILGALMPYTYPGNDLLSKLHVYFCMNANISFLVLLFIYNYRNSIYNYEVYKKTHYFFDMGLSFLCLVFVCFGSINGYIEIIYCILVTYYIHLINKA